MRLLKELLSKRSEHIKTDKAGVNQQEIIKITGHSSSSSLKPYLQLDDEHHLNLINKLRENREVVNLSTASTTEQNNVTKSTTHE